MILILGRKSRNLRWNKIVKWQKLCIIIKGSLGETWWIILIKKLLKNISWEWKKFNLIQVSDLYI